MKYRRPVPRPDRSARTKAVGLPTPLPSTQVFPLPKASTDSSCAMPVTVTVTGRSFGSTMPTTWTATIVWSGGQMMDTDGTALLQSGGAGFSLPPPLFAGGGVTTRAETLSGKTRSAPANAARYLLGRIAGPPVGGIPPLPVADLSRRFVEAIETHARVLGQSLRGRPHRIVISVTAKKKRASRSTQRSTDKALLLALVARRRRFRGLLFQS